jgi:hypothetical protein
MRSNGGMHGKAPEEGDTWFVSPTTATKPGARRGRADGTCPADLVFGPTFAC